MYYSSSRRLLIEVAINNFDTLVVFHILDLVSNNMCLIDDMQNGESAKGDTCQLNDAISVMSAVGCVIMRRIRGSVGREKTK